MKVIIFVCLLAGGFRAGATAYDAGSTVQILKIQEEYKAGRRLLFDRDGQSVAGPTIIADALMKPLNSYPGGLAHLLIKVAGQVATRGLQLLAYDEAKHNGADPNWGNPSAENDLMKLVWTRDLTTIPPLLLRLKDLASESRAAEVEFTKIQGALVDIALERGDLAKLQSRHTEHIHRAVSLIEQLDTPFTPSLLGIIADKPSERSTALTDDLFGPRKAEVLRYATDALMRMALNKNPEALRNECVAILMKSTPAHPSGKAPIASDEFDQIFGLK